MSCNGVNLPQNNEYFTSNLWGIVGIGCAYENMDKTGYGTSNGPKAFTVMISCIPGRKSRILRIQYGHAAAAAAEISFWTR